jgi:hypothetical protein
MTPDMKPQVAGTVAPGAALAFPIDLNNRPIRISAVGYTEDGRSHVTDLKEATQAVYTPTALDKTVKTGLFSLFNFTFTGTTQLAGLGTVVNDGTNYYNYLMPAGTLSEGDSIFVEYAFELLNDGNQKIHTANFFGYVTRDDRHDRGEGSGWMRATFQVQVGRDGQIQHDRRRQDDATLMSEVVLNETGEITGLDLANDDYTWGYTVTSISTRRATVLSSWATRSRCRQPTVDDTDYLTTDTAGYFLFSDDYVSPLVPE